MSPTELIAARPAASGAPPPGALPPGAAPPAMSERAVVLLVAAVQFINILEFMIVMPLGPDFARDLDIPVSHLGLIGGSYTAAAAVSGLIASTFLERFDRRTALAGAMAGLVLATLTAGLAWSLESLLLARVLAGMFGGPGSSIALAIIADTIPPERRGKAMSTVMMAFSLASIIGVPAGLELARHGGWRTPFFAVAVGGVLIAGSALRRLPPLRVHLDRAAQRRAGGASEGSLGEMLRRRVVLDSYAMSTCAMLSAFLLVPNLSAYLQLNLGFSRARLGLLYMVGGAATFVIMRPIGWLTDRHGPFVIGSLGTLSYVIILWVGFVAPQPWLPVFGLFTAFMVSSSLRNVPLTTLSSQVPRPHERARYMSIQSSVQHMAAAAGAFLSSRMLGESGSGALQGVPRIALVSVGFAALAPVLLHRVHAAVREDRAAAVQSPQEAVVE